MCRHLIKGDGLVDQSLWHGTNDMKIKLPMRAALVDWAMSHAGPSRALRPTGE